MTELSQGSQQLWTAAGLNATFLEQIGIDWISAWLRTRLSGSDAFAPLDGRTDEDPEAIIVSFIRQVGSRSPSAVSIGQAVVRLLDDCSPPNLLQPYLKSLLRLCQRVVLPATNSWFTEQLLAAANDRASFRERWLTNTNEVLYSCAQQAPGYVGSATRDSWLALLRQPDTTTVAWYALARTNADRIRHLSSWWATAPDEETQRELRYLLFTGLKDNEPDEFLSLIESAGSAWSQSLRDAIDSELKHLGTSPIFVTASSRSLHCAIDGAARRRTFVLGANA